MGCLKIQVFCTKSQQIDHNKKVEDIQKFGSPRPINIFKTRDVEEFAKIGQKLGATF